MSTHRYCYKLGILFRVPGNLISIQTGSYLVKQFRNYAGLNVGTQNILQYA